MSRLQGHMNSFYLTTLYMCSSNFINDVFLYGIGDYIESTLTFQKVPWLMYYRDYIELCSDYLYIR